MRDEGRGAPAREAVHRSSFIAHRLLSSLWFGSAFFLVLAASAAFAVAPNATVAADVVGAMLARWHYIALAAPLALFVLELRRVRRLVLIVLFAALVFAAVQVVIDLRIRAFRTSSPVPVSSLERDHPVRKRFGALHGMSMALLLLQLIAAAMVVAARERNEEPDMSTFETDDPTIYKVVRNTEEQYSIWPADRENPLGWTDAGYTGLKQDCLQYIKEVWPDTRPKSVREQQADTSGGGP